MGVQNPYTFVGVNPNSFCKFFRFQQEMLKDWFQDCNPDYKGAEYSANKHFQYPSICLIFFELRVEIQCYNLITLEVFF